MVKLPFRHAVAGLFVCTLALGTLPAWAQPAILEQVDVVSSRYGTEFKLHADQPIQHRVLQASDTHMVLELQGVVTPHSVRTNFAQAQDVRHVIFQPNGNERLKINVRGQQLGKPLVQVVYPIASTASGSQTPKANPIKSTPKVTSQPVETPQATIHSEAPKVIPAAKPEIAPEVDAETIQTIGSKTLEIPETTTQPENTPDGQTIAAQQAITNEINRQTTNIEPSISTDAEEAAASGLFGMEDEVTPTQTAESQGTFTMLVGELGQLSNSLPIGTIAMVLGLLLMIGGLGVFIRYKWQQLTGEDAGEPRERAQRPTAGASPFRQMARQHRSNSFGSRFGNARQDILEDETEETPYHHFNGNSHPTKANMFAARPKTNLHQPVKHAPQPIQQRQREANRTPMADPASLKRQQGMRQYQQANTVTPKAASRQEMPHTLQPQAMQFERISRSELGNSRLHQQDNSFAGLQRQAGVATQTHTNNSSKPHASLPRPQSGEPLPGNPHVLNFLKDVASYMEQDGDKHRARQITKSLKKFS